MSSRHAPTGHWQFYTVEVAPVGTRGPFGPFEAASEEAASRVAEARAKHSGLTVERIERAVGCGERISKRRLT